MKLRRIIVFALIAPVITTIALMAKDIEGGSNDIDQQVNQTEHVLSLESDIPNNVLITPVNESSKERGDNIILGSETHNVDQADISDHHPKVKLFGLSLGTLGQFGVTVFNFLLFASILIFTLKGILKSAFATHRKEISDKLLKAEQDKNEAEKQMKSLEIKMSELQDELDNILAKSELDAKVEQNHLIEAAKVEAEQILSQAREYIETMKKNTEVELRALVTELVINNATKLLETKLHSEVASDVINQAIERMRGNK